MRIILALAIAAVALSPTAAWSAGTLDKDMTLEHDGLTRYFESYVPDGLPDSPVPLLFVFHGGGLDNDNILQNPVTQEFISLADEELFIVLIPNGTTKTGETGPSGGFAWNHCRTNNSRTADDEQLEGEAIRHPAAIREAGSVDPLQPPSAYKSSGDRGHAAGGNGLVVHDSP